MAAKGNGLDNVVDDPSLVDDDDNDDKCKQDNGFECFKHDR